MIDFETEVRKSPYIFIIETECDQDIITRLYIIFTRRRIPVLDFQSVRLNDGDKMRILIIAEESKENILKLCNLVERQVDVMSVNLFESIYRQ
jgi:hypothetical protein